MLHDYLHRRHPRKALAWPDPEAIASAFAAPFAKPGPQKTITSYYYKTLSPTFDAPIAGYSTQGQGGGSNDDVTAQPAATTTAAAAQPTPNDTGDDDGGTNTSAAQASSLTGMPASILAPSTSLASTVPLVAATSTLQSSASTARSASFASSSSTVSQDSSSSNDMTAGAQAGIAIGVILAVGALASLILFCLRQRKKAAERQRLDDEKYFSNNDAFVGNRVPSTRSARTASTAPRLSLRPVTQFLPGFVDNTRASRGNLLNSAPATAGVPMTSQNLSPKSAWERPMTSDSQNRANPFGNHAEHVDAVNAAGPPVVQEMATASEIMAGAAVAGAAGAGAVTRLARGASKHGNGPKPLDFTKTLPGVGPASPAGTEFSMSSAVAGAPVQTNGAAAIAAAGGPLNSTVHRVQLDFSPSMDDELELRAGQLIRLLHEYDDGWALCIRLDRSQQGVVPRTCLSTRPVKPRPQQNPPRGNPPPGMRVPQQQQQGRPMSPAMNLGQRPASPAGARPSNGGPQYPPQGRPSSPAGNRPSPGGAPYNPQGRAMTPNGGPRSNSPSPTQMQDRRNSPPGPSAMGSDSTRSPYGSPPKGMGIGRKPVPGQAM